MEFKDSKTYKNLMEAFDGEAKAFTKYDLFSGRAKKDGYVAISRIFAEIAGNEREHAQLWWKAMHDNKNTSTEYNIQNCIDNENYEAKTMYLKFANMAYEEGYKDIGDLFFGVAQIEAQHSVKYQELIASIQDKTIFYSEEPTDWICLNCGHIHKNSQTPPELCEVCSHPKAYFVKLNKAA